MARIDSILGIVLQQGCDELRVATDTEPKMFARGVAKRLHMGVTSDETLRDLLGEILAPERETELAARGRSEVRYRSESGATFDVTLVRRSDAGLEVRFLRSMVKASLGAVPAPAPLAAPLSAAPPAADGLPPGRRPAGLTPVRRPSTLKG